MTKITLVRHQDGSFASCDAAGHAGFDKAGQDIVCAAVTVLLRTAMQVLSAANGVSLTADKECGRGELHFSVGRDEDGADRAAVNARLVCVADFLESGIGALEREYPLNVKLIKRQTQSGGAAF